MSAVSPVFHIVDTVSWIRPLTLVSLFIDYQYTTGWGQYSKSKTLSLIYKHTEDRLGTLEVLSNSPVSDINKQEFCEFDQIILLSIICKNVEL